MDLTSLFSQFVIAIVGGLLSGGIISWIEIQRFRREQKEREKKVELQVICADVMEMRWDPSKVHNSENRLRIYEEKLEGRLKSWIALVKFTVTNLTDHDLLILSINSDFPKPEITVSPFVKPEEVKKFTGSTRKYDLLKKCLLNSGDFPLELPAKSQMGVVLVAYVEIDRSLWVDDGPSHVKVSVKLDDGRTHGVEVQLAEAVEMSEVDWTYDDNLEPKELHWVPYLMKNNIDYGLPF